MRYESGSKGSEPATSSGGRKGGGPSIIAEVGQTFGGLGLKFYSEIALRGQKKVFSSNFKHRELTADRFVSVYCGSDFEPKCSTFAAVFGGGGEMPSLADSRSSEAVAKLTLLMMSRRGPRHHGGA